jgi:hypothetical protein
MTSTLSPKRFLRHLLVLGVLGLCTFTAQANPVISEFMASNSRTLADDDGAFSDWIEIHNPTGAALDLTGWYLTDSAGNPTKWKFPQVVIPAGGYLVVFASGKDRTASATALHTNFALSAGGEYLALVQPDGTTIAHEYAPTFPAQTADVSYGVVTSANGTSLLSFLAAPSPGTANSGIGPGTTIANTVTFSHSGGPFRGSVTLDLSGAGSNQVIRYAVGTGSGALNAEVTAASPVFTGPITITNTSVVRAAIFNENGSSGPVRSVHFARLDSGLGTFSSRLPVLVIDNLGLGPLVKDDIDHESWVYTYPARNSGVPTFIGAPDLVSEATTSVRGSSSADFPKKSLNLTFRDAEGSKRAAAPLDLPAAEKWALVAPWKFDLTYLTNSVLYSLSNSIGRWAPRTRLVEVFFNTGGDAIEVADYAGIYAVTDRIEVGRDRVNIAALTAGDTSAEAISGGYILKIDTPDADEVSWMPQRLTLDAPDSALVLAAPKAEDVTPAQLGYIRNYVQRMENALHSDRAGGWAQRTYLDYLDRSSWVDFHLLNVFSANPDAFVRSTFFHKDRGGKIVAGPIWDFDRALGSTHDNRSERYDVWSGYGVHDYWRSGWFGLLAEDPEFMQEWVDRWQSLRRAEFLDHSLATLVDAWSAQIGNDTAARDGTRWPDNQTPYGDYVTTARYLREWVVNRARWIDAQFVAPPEVSASAGSITFIPRPGTQLAYTLDGSDPRALGGALAPNALVTATALTVPADANVHVRSYHPDVRYALPGSPWSSAVGGAHSSPLAPAARLVNLSSRAIVGSGEKALITGVVIADTESKRFLSRAVGPSLAAFGATGYLADPQLSILGQNGVELFRNHHWETGPDAARIPSFARAVGAFPLTAGAGDAALASPLAAGSYSVQVTPASGRDGVALAELYELDGNGRTVNLSTRAYVQSGEGVLIGGFVVSGPAWKRLLIRAIGPTLRGFGVGDALPDPVLTIYSGTRVVAQNDRWESAENSAAIATATRRIGAFDLAAGGEDAALLITLPPGAYTVEVKGKAAAEGVALLEIYDVP